MFGDNKDCPIRITTIFGYDKLAIEGAAKRMGGEFGWKIHSWAKLESKVHPTVHSVILFNTKTDAN